MRKEQVYLAARYSRQTEMREVARELEDMGYEMSCRWISGDHQIKDGLCPDEELQERIRFALEDYHDVVASNIIISFTEVPRSSTTRGGRHVEFGIGLGIHKRLVNIGPRENIFHYLPQVEVYDSWEQARTYLEADVIIHDTGEDYRFQEVSYRLKGIGGQGISALFDEYTQEWDSNGMIVSYPDYDDWRVTLEKNGYKTLVRT